MKSGVPGLQLPASLKLEPMKYASGVVEERAGSTLPDTSVLVLNGHKKRMSSSMTGKKSASFTIVQRLWRLEGASGVKSLKVSALQLTQACTVSLDFRLSTAL